MKYDQSLVTSFLLDNLGPMEIADIKTIKDSKGFDVIICEIEGWDYLLKITFNSNASCTVEGIDPKTGDVVLTDLVQSFGVFALKCFFMLMQVDTSETIDMLRELKEQNQEMLKIIQAQTQKIKQLEGGDLNVFSFMLSFFVPCDHSRSLSFDCKRSID